MRPRRWRRVGRANADKGPELVEGPDPSCLRISVIGGSGRAAGASKAPAEGTKASAPVYAGAEALLSPWVSNSRCLTFQLDGTQGYNQPT